MYTLPNTVHKGDYLFRRLKPLSSSETSVSHNEEIGYSVNLTRLLLKNCHSFHHFRKDSLEIRFLTRVEKPYYNSTRVYFYLVLLLNSLRIGRVQKWQRVLDSECSSDTKCVKILWQELNVSKTLRRSYYFWSVNRPFVSSSVIKLGTRMLGLTTVEVKSGVIPELKF